MSTITKLNPRVRKERSERRAMLKGLERMAHGVADAQRALSLLALHSLLASIAQSSWRSGWRKSSLFTRIARELSGTQK